jgi:hypothetical protein
MKLVVTHAFADYPVGFEITDPAKIQEILGGEQAHYVVKVAIPAPEKKSK